jgi:hypothetical protein
MPTKRKIKTPNATAQRTSTKCDPVQRAVLNSQRELDNREYGEGYEGSRKEALCDPEPAEDQGTDEGRSDTVEGAVNNLWRELSKSQVAGLKLYPPVPPPALFEAAELIEAATAFWGLEEGDLTGTSKKPEICWPRFVCCWILKQKGLSNKAIGKVLGKRKHSTVFNEIKQFKALSEAHPAYKEQAKAFDRYCWNTVGQLPTKRYKAGMARP